LHWLAAEAIPVRVAILATTNGKCYCTPDQVARQDKPNALLTVSEIDKFCAPDSASETQLRQAITHLNLSARAYHRVLKVVRTIADLEGSNDIQIAHITDAMQYWRMDKQS